MPEPAEADELYQVAPERFIAARDALVKMLRAANRREEAALVAKRRRPPATAWALNQLARTRPELVAAVLEAGNHLRKAMAHAVGGDAAGMRAAQDAERKAAAEALDAAAGILEKGEHRASDDARQKMGATLRAAVVDEELAARLSRGVIDTDHDAPGFGFGADTPAPARVAAGKRPAPAPDGEARERERQERLETRRLEEEADRLARRAERLQAEAQEAAVVAARAQHAAVDAEREADAARQALEAKRPES